MNLKTYFRHGLKRLTDFLYYGHINKLMPEQIETIIQDSINKLEFPNQIKDDLSKLIKLNQVHCTETELVNIRDGGVVGVNGLVDYVQVGTILLDPPELVLSEQYGNARESVQFLLPKVQKVKGVDKVSIVLIEPHIYVSNNLPKYAMNGTILHELITVGNNLLTTSQLEQQSSFAPQLLMDKIEESDFDDILTCRLLNVLHMHSKNKNLENFIEGAEGIVIFQTLMAMKENIKDAVKYCASSKYSISSLMLRIHENNPEKAEELVNKWAPASEIYKESQKYKLTNLEKAIHLQKSNKIQKCTAASLYGTSLVFYLSACSNPISLLPLFLSININLGMSLIRKNKINKLLSSYEY